MRKVGTDNHPNINRMLIGFINDQMRKYENLISVYKPIVRARKLRGLDSRGFTDSMGSV